MWKFALTAVLAVWSAQGRAAAQPAPLTGRVTDATDSRPLPGVIVELVDGSGTMLTYTMTAADGTFSVTPPREAAGHGVRFTAMSYRRSTVELQGVTTPLEVSLVPEPTAIREIQVKAPDIVQRGDTLVFNVERYADISDRSIADVLRKMPGIEIAESGQISYQGEPINKFYIEGIDMLDGRYGLATNNISHKDVQAVELMENHQPVRALQDIVHSDQAALNIRLKEDAKSRWVGTVAAGGGYAPALYDAALFAMRISGGWQSMENLKVDNTGKDLARENMRFSTYDIFKEMVTRNLSPALISADVKGAPIDDARTRRNRSLLFNSTNAVRAGEDMRLDAEVNYYGERLTSSSNTLTRYFDPGIDDFRENIDFVTHLHELSARVTAEVNTPNYFLRTDLESQLKWKDATSRIGGTTQSRQRADLPQRTVSGRLQLIKRKGKRIFTVNSDNRWQGSPRTLAVDRSGDALTQDASYRVLHSQTDLSYGRGAGCWQLSARGGVMFRCNTIESTLSGWENATFQTANDLRFFQTRTFVSPSAVYQKRRIRLTLAAPLNVRSYRYSDRSQGGHKSRTTLSVDPSAALRYEISALLTFHATATYSQSPVNERIFYGGAIMRDYRNVIIGYPLFDSGSTRAVSAGLRYRNPVKSLFAHLNAGYTNAAVVPISARYFTDGYVVSTYSDTRATAGTWYARFGVSKGLGSGGITVGADGSLDLGRSAMVLEGEKTPYRSQNYSVEPHFKGRIARWLSAEYRLTLGREVLELDGGGPKSEYNTASQTLAAVFRLHEKLQLHGRAEHYFTDLEGGGNRNLVLVDASLRWNVSGGLDVGCSGTNLLNRKSFNYSTLASLSSSETLYSIRKRAVMVSAYFTF